VCCLIVDDSETNRVFLGHLVRKMFAQCDVVFAESGEAAVLQAAECCPDVILMDVRMPGGMSGIETTRKIRKELSSVPIVGVTGASDATTLRECMEAGMNDVLVKPLRQDMVSAAVVPLVKLDPSSSAVSPRKHAFLVDESFLSDIDEAHRKPLLDDWRIICGEQIAKMFRLCSEKAWKDLQDVAHALKGSSAQIGAVTMSESAAKVEALARDGEENLVATLSNQVRELAVVTDLTLVQFNLSPLALTSVAE